MRSLVYAEAILWSTNETSLLESILNSAAGSGKYSREGLSSLYVAESEAHLFTNESYILYSLWYILLSSNKGEYLFIREICSVIQPLQQYKYFFRKDQNILPKLGVQFFEIDSLAAKLFAIEFRI